MYKGFLATLAALLLLGCGTDAQSQDKLGEKSTRSQDAVSVSDAVTSSRQNAITQAVSVARDAVVSVNVIEVQTVRYRDPFNDFFSDDFFRQFFGSNPGRQYEREVQGLGSGFVISEDGYIVTNDHVAGRASRITVSFRDGSTKEARLVGTDEVTDVTLLKVDTNESLPYLRFAAEETPIVGEWAIALGNPFGLFDATEPTVTVGVVSAVERNFTVQDRRIYRNMIQTDAAINRGNSGGPLINALGEVIGVNTFIVSPNGGGSIGLGFAVPAAKVLRIVNELRETGEVDRSYYTGLRVRNVNERIASALNLDGTAGVLVESIDPSSPAEAAGFSQYDVIVGISGEAVADRNSVVARLYDFRPGDELEFVIWRDGQQRQLRMILGRQ